MNYLFFLLLAFFVGKPVTIKILTPKHEPIKKVYVEMVKQIVEGDVKMMKTLNEYMEIVEDKEESGYVISYPNLPGCITCGEIVESAVANALDAKRTWIEAAIEEEDS